MKLTAIILFCFCFSASATGYAQTLTLSMKDAPLTKVFAEIEKQSGYKFLYTDQLIANTKNIDIEVKGLPVAEVLEICLKDQPISFTIVNKTVILKPTEKKTLATVAENESSQPDMTITGKVVDADGNPLSGATVTNKNNNNSTHTDNQGCFSIKGELGDVIVVTFVGFGIFIVKVTETNAANLTARLTPEVNSEAVVEVNAGYYKVRKAEQTGSTGSVNAKTIEKQPITNVLGAMAGRLPGVYIQQKTGVPGGEFQIEIRGMNSLGRDRSINEQPLYLVDGVPFSTERVSSQAAAGSAFNGGGASPLTGLNMADIESIEILRDADGTAIYGARGANGVILITTKKGKAGKTRINFDIYYGIGDAPQVKLLNTSEYLKWRMEAFANDSLTPSSDPLDAGYAPELTLWDTTRHTDWGKTLFGSWAKTSSIQSSISGGTDNTQFILSGGYRRETSVYNDNLSYQKGSLHLAVNHRSTNHKFIVAAQVNTAYDVNDQVAFDAVNLSRLQPPNAPSLYDSEGNLNWESSTWKNPMAAFFETYDSRVGTLIANISLDYQILSGLNIKLNAGVTSVESHEFKATPSTMNDPALRLTSANTAVVTSHGSNKSWILQPQTSWDHKISLGQLSVLVGGTFQGKQLLRTATHYYGFPSNTLLHDLQSASNLNPLEYVSSLYRYEAAFGRINYNWQGKYIINFTGTRDASSRFGPGKQFANFGAIGFAWIFSKETLIKDNFPFLSFGKLRGSYGITGNDQIGDYKYMDTYSSTQYAYQGVTGLGPTRLFNADYAWETNKKSEVALELGFLRGRLNTTIAYYRNRSSNQLVDYTLPGTTGFRGVLVNLGAIVQNSGVELELEARAVESTLLRWTSSFNVSVPRNKLISFPGLASSSYAAFYSIGQPLSVERYYEYTGVDAHTGLYTVRDMNGDGKILEVDDRKNFIYVGKDFFGGLNNVVSWKGFAFDIFFQFVKQTGYNISRLVLPGSQPNIPAYLTEEKVWRRPGDIATIQRLATSNNIAAVLANDLYANSTARITDASYIRLKNASLSYILPASWTKKSSCRVYLQGQNLLTITRYKSYDPETQYVSLGPLRMITAGFQLTL